MTDWVEVLPFLAAAGVAMLLLGGGRWQRRGRVYSRLNRALADAGQDHVSAGEAVPWSRRFLLPLLSGAGKTAARLYSAGALLGVERSLVLAGRPQGWGAREFLGLRALTAPAGLLAGLLLALTPLAPDLGLLFPVCLGVAGFVAPTLWLQRLIDGRQRALQRDLPDALDMMALCLDAGLGLEAAMKESTRLWPGPLTEEFGQVLSEIQLGWSRHDALRHLVQRTEVGELTAFASALIQAEQLGTSIRGTLKLQAIDARSAYMRAVREEGHKAPIKMMVPMTLFVLPAMFIVIIGPVLPDMARSMLGK